MSYAFLSKRAHFKYALSGLSHREEFLLKIILGMLNVKTQDHWVQDQTTPDFLIVSDAEFASAQMTTSHPIINISALQNMGAALENGVPSTNSRFNAHKIEEVLNRVGQDLRQRKQDATAHVHVDEVGESDMTSDSKQVSTTTYRLKRWPANHLLTSPAHVRVATLMLSTPVLMSTLAVKSGQDEAFCQTLIDNLAAAGYVLEAQLPVVTASKQGDAVLKSVSKEEQTNKPSVFASIRKRLGLSLFGT